MNTEYLKEIAGHIMRHWNPSEMVPWTKMAIVIVAVTDAEDILAWFQKQYETVAPTAGEIVTAVMRERNREAHLRYAR